MIVKTVKIRVFRAGNKESITHTTKAGRHKQFTAAGIERILAQYVEKIENIAPGEYRMVSIGPGEFNFVHL